MPPMDGESWLREYLDAIRTDVQGMRTQLDRISKYLGTLDQRVTILEAQRSQQKRTGEGIRHWLLLGAALASVGWTVWWTLLHG